MELLVWLFVGVVGGAFLGLLIIIVVLAYIEHRDGTIPAKSTDLPVGFWNGSVGE